MQEIVEVIKLNKIKCKKCGDIIESKTRNNFVWCSCKAIAVDGGHEYLRRVGDSNDIEDLSYVRKLMKIDTGGFEVVKNVLCKSNLDFENVCCPFCGSKNISIEKGERELIIGDDIIALACYDCKKIYGFSDVKYRKFVN